MRHTDSFLANLQRTLDQTKWRIKGLRVVALVGKAGSGKSFRARLIADAHHLDAILDDGLLIVQGKIVAGHSAKREEHFLAAIKTAMFHDDAHRAAVKRGIREAGIGGILMLGTSERMIHRNCLSLGLPEPAEIIRIEDLASAQEIETAQSERRRGKHVIPIPVLEVRQAYPKLWARALKVWFERGMGRLTHKTYEKTEVWPVYSKEGAVSLSERALSEMVVHCFNERAPGVVVRKIRIIAGQDGFEIRLHIALPYGLEVAQTCHSLREYAMTQVESLTGIQIRELLIRVDTIIAQPAAQRN